MGARAVPRRAPGAPVALALLALLAAGCNVVRPKALVIGVDGLRADELERARTPALDGLAARGAATFDARPSADGGASWSVLLCGVSPAADGDALPSLFERLKAVRPRAETGWFTAGDDALPGAAHAGVDCFFAPSDAGRSSVERDRETIDAALEALAGGGRFGGADLELAFVHLSGPDAGDGAEAGLAATDALVAELLAAIEARPARREERWLVLVAATGGAGDDQGRLPLVVAADGLLPHRIELVDASLSDVAPTVLSWLDVPRGKLPGRRLAPR
jgi:hypothetical protein